MDKKLLSSGFINIVFKGALYINDPMCFFGHSMWQRNAIDLRKALRAEKFYPLGGRAAWRTQDGWFVPVWNKKYMWRLNIPTGFANPVIDKTPDNFYTYRNKTDEVVIEAERVMMAELEICSLFL